MKLAELLPRPSLIICAKCGSINIQIMDWINPNTEQFIGGADDPNELNTYCENCEDNTGIVSLAISGLTEVEVELAITKAIRPKGALHMIPNDFLPLDQQTNSLGNRFDPDYLDSPV